MTMCTVSDAASGAVAHVATLAVGSAIAETLFRLGLATMELLEIRTMPGDRVCTKLFWFLRCYPGALHASNLNSVDVLRRNIAKV